MMAEDLNNYRNALYLSLNNTLGGAFCIDGTLIPGANQKAGEFGHMILVPGGKKCYCGKQGCADAYCAASVLTDDTKETLEQFMKKVEEQDGQAVKVWKEYLNNLAILISNLRRQLCVPIRGDCRSAEELPMPMRPNFWKLAHLQ